MSYEASLFLDDFRNPKDVKWVELPDCTWTIVRNFNEFQEWVLMYGLPKRVAFDHDLADEHMQEYFWCHDEMNVQSKGEFRYDKMQEKTGYDAAKWLCDYCQENKIKFPEYHVHSMNPIGSENIRRYIENYKRVVETK